MSDVKIVTYHLKPNGMEFPSREALDRANKDNWAKLTNWSKRRCLEHLRRSLVSAGHEDLIDRWREQIAAGQSPGTDQPMFHFGGGQAVRNMLRQALPDHKLPDVDLPDGSSGRNWDDYYIGAIYALVQEVDPIRAGFDRWFESYENEHAGQAVSARALALAGWRARKQAEYEYAAGLPVLRGNGEG